MRLVRTIWVAKAFKSWIKNTFIYTLRNSIKTEKNHQSYHGAIVPENWDVEDGRIESNLSDLAAPYIFELQQNFYTLKLRELSLIKI